MLAEHELEPAVAALRAPLLLLHAEGDEQVPVEHSRELAAARHAPGSRLIEVPGGHHRSIQHDAELQAVSLRFIEQALGLRARPGDRSAPELSSPTRAMPPTVPVTLVMVPPRPEPTAGRPGRPPGP